MKILTLFVILMISLFLVSCNTTSLFMTDSNCKQKYQRHYDKKGHFTGTTQWMECD